MTCSRSSSVNLSCEKRLSGVVHTIRRLCHFGDKILFQKNIFLNRFLVTSLSDSEKEDILKEVLSGAKTIADLNKQKRVSVVKALLFSLR